jgi:hypothetical protein
MQSGERLPAEREIAYIASLAAVGAVFAYIAWAVCSTAFPTLELNWAKWSFVGGGLAGTAGLAWIVARTLLN